MKRAHPMTKTILAAIAFLLPLAGAMADAPGEVQTAMKHAGFAMMEKAVDGVHLHLHHTINCLVGPQGKGFDAKAGDPCKGMGNGAINDTNDAQMKAMLMHVVTLASTAEEIHSYEAAKDVAMAVHTLLSEASKSK